jgi:hypothetical protein
MIIFDIICFSVYYDYMFSIVDLTLYPCMELYSPHLDHLLTWVNSKDTVSVVLILYLSVIAPYMHYVKTSNRSHSICNGPLMPVTSTHICNGCCLALVTYKGASTTQRLASTTPVTNVDFW